MASESVKRVSGFSIAFVAVTLGLPWLGWVYYPSARALHYALANMAVAIVIAFGVQALQQLCIALAARALGDRVPFVSVGVGPVVWSRSSSGRQLTLRLLPANASNVIATIRKRGQRARTAAALFAGAAVPGAMLAALLVCHPASWADRHAIFATRLAPDVLFVYLAGWIVYAATLSAFGALFASKGFSNLDESIYKVRRAYGHAIEAELAVGRGAYEQGIAIARRGLEEDPDNLLLHVTLAAAMCTSRHPEAFERIEQLLKRDLPPAVRPLCLNLRAWECYLTGRDELRAEADRLSHEAITAMPNHPSIIDTRGHVLLWKRRLPEAEDHLRRAFQLTTSRAGRASSAAGLAMICAAADRPDEATTWLARAREQDSEHVLLARATAAVEPLRRL